MSVIFTDSPISDKPKRLEKGKSILVLEDDYIVIDLETTGLDPTFDEILEIGAVKYENRVEVSRFQCFVKPENEIPEFITDLTGITNEMVADSPSIDAVLPAFLEFIGHSLLVGHNVNFDINFLYDNAMNYGLGAVSNDFVDTMRLSRRLYPDWTNHRLKTMIRELGIGKDIEHRALGDCIQTAQSYEAMKHYAQDTNADLSSPTKHKTSIKDITFQPDAGMIDPESPIFGKTFVFTGALDRMVRRDAMQLVVNIGGYCGDNVTKETDFLVLGNNDYCSSIKDGKSSKQKKAEKMKASGHDIEIISEDVFYDMLEE